MHKINFDIFDDHNPVPTEEPKPESPRKEVSLVPKDITHLKAEMAQTEQAIEALVKQAETHAITDDASAVVATDIVGQLKRIEKEIENRRKAIVEEPNKYVKRVNDFCKGLIGRIGQGIYAIDARQRSFRAAQLAKQREIEAREREAREALQKQIDEAAKAGGYEAPVVPEIVQPPVEKVTRGETGASTHFRKEWKFEIENEAEVPREYCSVDERKIRAAVKAGIREIAGIRIYEDEVPVHRTI